jgi:hypothetical protein
VGSQESKITGKAEKRSDDDFSRHVADAITEKEKTRHDEALAIGEWVRDWYIARAIHSEIKGGALEWLQMATTFWWENRAIIGALRQRVDELEEDLEAMSSVLDPELEYQRRTDQLAARALQFTVLGIHLPEAYWNAEMKSAEEHREKPHLPAEWVTSLLSEAGVINDGGTTSSSG